MANMNYKPRQKYTGPSATWTSTVGIKCQECGCDLNRDTQVRSKDITLCDACSDVIVAKLEENMRKLGML